MLGQFQEVYISKIEKDYLRLENVLASEMNGKIDSVIFDSASMPWLVQKGYVDSLSFTFHNRAEPPTLVHVNSIRAFELPAVSLQLKNGKKYKALFFNAVAVEKKIDPNKELPEERIMKSRAAYLKGIGIGYIRIDVGHGMVLEYEFNSILDKAGFDKRLEELGKKLNNGTK